MPTWTRPVIRRKRSALKEIFNNRQMKQAISGADYLVYTSARVDENNVNADVEETEMARNPAALSVFFF